MTLVQSQAPVQAAGAQPPTQLCVAWVGLHWLFVLLPLSLANPCSNALPCCVFYVMGLVKDEHRLVQSDVHCSTYDWIQEVAVRAEHQICFTCIGQLKVFVPARSYQIIYQGSIFACISTALRELKHTVRLSLL